MFYSFQDIGQARNLLHISLIICFDATLNGNLKIFIFQLLFAGL